MSGPRISDAHPGDLPAIAALESQVFDTPWDEDSLRGELARPIARLRVAHVSDRVAGHLLMWTAGGDAEVIVTAVSPQMRRRGVGTALIEDLQSCAREAGAKRIFLEVRASNRAAIGLYEKAGFCELDRRERYYGDGEDAIVMALELGEQLHLSSADAPRGGPA